MCSKDFSQRVDLKMHHCMHAKEKSFICEICNNVSYTIFGIQDATKNFLITFCVEIDKL